MGEKEKINKILIVDDSEMNRMILSDMLSEQYEVLEARDGFEAIDMIHKYEKELSLILLDIIMPKMDGFEVLEMMHRYQWILEIPVITISAEHSHDVIERAFELGAADYISRPFDEVIVRKRVVNTIMLYSKQKRLVSLVADQMYEAERSNTMMISILSHIVEFRNGESGIHVLHIGTMTEMLLNKLREKTDIYDLDEIKVSLISKAAAFHDIGKISIDEDILNKPGRLTDEEFAVVKKHSMIGAEMLDNLPLEGDELLVKYAYEICRWHHERFDGSGYPDGLKGDEIPISAQVVSVADAYDALISDRVYKKAYSYETALQMILDGKCGEFNPLVLQCLAEIADDIEEALSIDSFSCASEKDIRSIVGRLLSHKEIASSNRILSLLEEERAKFKFHFSTARQLHFDYNPYPSVLTFSKWGAKRLGVPMTIVDPRNDQNLRSIISVEKMEELRDLVKATTVENPVVEYRTNLMIDGKETECYIICRPFWRDGKEDRYSVVTGKVVRVEDYCGGF